MSEAFDAADADWHSLMRTSAGKAFMTKLASNPTFGPEITADLLNRLRGYGPDTREDLDAMFMELFRIGTHDPIAQRVVLQVILPGLCALAGRMLRNEHANELNEKAAEILSAAGIRIATFPFERRSHAIPMNILLDVRRDFLRHRKHRQGVVPIEDFDLLQPWDTTDVAGTDPVEQLFHRAELDCLLRQAARARAIDAGDLHIVVATRLAGREVEDVATELGIRPDTARRSRHRAEERLADWYRTTDEESRATAVGRRRRPRSWQTEVIAA